MTDAHLRREQIEVICVDPWTRRRRLIIAAIVGALLIAGVTAASLLHHREAERPPAHPGVVMATSLPGPLDTAPPAAPLGKLADPESFARRVAHALFDWDTTQIEARREAVEALVAVGDPTGGSTPGLATDIENYLPPSAAWADLQQYSTRQRIEISSMRMPTSWSQAKRQAGPDGLLPGTTAYTIHGTRHRGGTWEGRAVSSQHDVAFTVFIVCAPSYEDCRLLRLSRPDAPLR